MKIVLKSEKKKYRKFHKKSNLMGSDMQIVNKNTIERYFQIKFSE